MVTLVRSEACISPSAAGRKNHIPIDQYSKRIRGSHAIDCQPFIKTPCPKVRRSILLTLEGYPLPTSFEGRLGGGKKREGEALMQHTCEDNKTNAGVVEQSSSVLQACGTYSQ